MSVHNLRDLLLELPHSHSRIRINRKLSVNNRLAPIIFPIADLVPNRDIADWLTPEQSTVRLHIDALLLTDLNRRLQQPHKPLDSLLVALILREFSEYL